MDPRSETEETIHRELTGTTDGEVRTEYMKHFGPDVRKFSALMAATVSAWRKFDSSVRGDERQAVVSNLIYATFTLHIISFKLILAGLIVPAGNAFRQVVECVALSLLCSGKDLQVLQQFMSDQYSSSKAIRDVLRHADKLSLDKEALKALESAEGFYHKYSHVTRLTLATMISFSEEGAYVGASFDEKKLDAYRKEVAGRLGLASVLPNVIAAIQHNVAQWPRLERSDV